MQSLILYTYENFKYQRNKFSSILNFQHMFSFLSQSHFTVREIFK